MGASAAGRGVLVSACGVLVSACRGRQVAGREARVFAWGVRGPRVYRELTGAAAADVIALQERAWEASRSISYATIDHHLIT